MSENLFTAVLTFSLLAGGTAAVGAELLASHRPAARAAAVATLPAVTVVGKRIVAEARADAVTLPMVMVTGRRQALVEVAADDTDRGQRVE
jgi:hypothetical protein